MTLASRVATLAAVLTMCVGNLGVCAGWQATAEARMACCMNGTSCPMHASDSHGSRSTRTITQVHADNCCAAASSRTQSFVASSLFALAHATPLPFAASLVVPVPVSALQEWRALVPLPASPVPKHLLHSVLLV